MELSLIASIELPINADCKSSARISFCFRLEIICEGEMAGFIVSNSRKNEFSSFVRSFFPVKKNLHKFMPFFFCRLLYPIL